MAVGNPQHGNLMRPCFAGTVISAMAIVMVGCATKPYAPERFVLKSSGEAGARNAVFEECWQWVLNTKEGQATATQLRTARAVGTLIGSPLALAYVAATEKSGREETANQQAHLSCMVDRKAYKYRS